MTVIGTLIGHRFRLEERIGSGGMSSVYRAFDPTLERSVAIKLMHRDISTDPDQLERFRREARAVAQLNHPHVVTVIDAGEDEGAPYIVFEYIEGETLKERIRRHGRLPVAEAVAYAIEIGRALESAPAPRYRRPLQRWSSEPRPRRQRIATRPSATSCTTSRRCWQSRLRGAGRPPARPPPSCAISPVTRRTSPRGGCGTPGEPCS